MSKIAALLKKSKKEKLIFNNHPCKDLDLESKINYLNGLSLIMNEDNDINQKEKDYLLSLIHTFNFEKEQLDDLIDFAKDPDEETVLNIFKSFNTNLIKNSFLLDSMLIAYSDGRLCDKETELIKLYSSFLELDENVYSHLEKLSYAINNKDVESIKELLKENSYVTLESILHYLDFFKIDIYQKEKLKTNFNKISSGKDFVIVINNRGKVKSIGSNSYGYLGIGTEDYENYINFQNVIDLPKDSKCISVDCGRDHTLALFDNGDIYSWGDNSSYGKLGIDTDTKRPSPFKVIGLPKNEKPIKILASADSSFVLYENGELYVSGEMTNSKIFKKHELEFSIIDFEIMYDSYDKAIVFLDENNKIIIYKIYSLNWCRFDDKNLFTPTGLPEDIKIKQISAGSEHIHVLLENNELYAIGKNNDGQLGTGKRDRRIDTFTKIYEVEKIKQISTNHISSTTYQSNLIYNYVFTLALTNDVVMGWGANNYSQLGEKENYERTWREEGLVFKKTIWNKEYLEVKPKIIEEFNTYYNKKDDFVLLCTNNASFLCNLSKSKLYEIGSGIGNSSSKITEFKF